MTSSWDRARAVADAVLYEGYLLYPYRATSSKNQSRWQFGVLGQPGAADAGLGEDDSLAAQFLVDGAQAIIVRGEQPSASRVHSQDLEEVRGNPAHTHALRFPATRDAEIVTAIGRDGRETGIAALPVQEIRIRNRKAFEIR